MKNFTQLTNEKLHSETLAAASNEKSATLALLDHLAEVDRRRLYAAMGYSSLWLYVNQALGYSESQASERVSAVRLMVRVPEVKEELESGKISLTAVAKLAAHVRREKADVVETRELLGAIAGKTSREVERVLASEAGEVARPDQWRAISTETTRITIDVDSEFLEIMNRVRELKGHPGSSAQELFRMAMQDMVKRHELKRARKMEEAPARSDADIKVKEEVSVKADVNVKKLVNADEDLDANASELRAQKVLLTPVRDSKRKNSRYVSTEIKTKIRQRSGDQCEYFDPNTKRRCDCRMKLQFDHIQPFALGGETTLENMRHLCSAHNRLAAIRRFGEGSLRRSSVA